MGNVYKGRIASISGNTARVVPLEATERPTARIVIPWTLRGDTGRLKKGTEVVYAEFADGTGILLYRADGEWGEYIPRIKVEKVEAPSGDITAQGVSLAGHTHGGVMSGSGKTDDPDRTTAPETIFPNLE